MVTVTLKTAVSTIYSLYVSRNEMITASYSILCDKRFGKISKKKSCLLTLNLLTTTIVAPPSNASKWQMGFNSAFKGLIKKPELLEVFMLMYIHTLVYYL